MDAVSGGHIEGVGTSEAGWLASPLVRGMPTVTPAQLLADARRLLVVAPHPDDEVLGCGGFMALAAATGLDVRVAAVTDGEHCYPDLPGWPVERLAATRRVELLHALAALGIPATAVDHLGIPDGAVGAHVDRLQATLAGDLSADDLVLVTWARDGHPDHEACATAALAAAAGRRARTLQYPVWGWHWAHPDAPDLADAAPVRLPLPPRIRAAKARALACFASQLGTGPVAIPDPILPAHVLQRFSRDFEVFLP